MNEVLKQRLVGALILVALGVIFWPIVFVQPKPADLVPQQSIPPQPGVSTDPVASPDPVGLRPSPALTSKQPEQPAQLDPETAAQDSAAQDPAEQAPAAAVPASREVAAATRRDKPEELAVDVDGVPVAWILQVASVSDAEKAESLRQRLIDMDKKAYVTRVSANGKTLHRVYIGPKFEKAQLENMRSSIDEEFGVSSMVRRYVP